MVLASGVLYFLCLIVSGSVSEWNLWEPCNTFHSSWSICFFCLISPQMGNGLGFPSGNERLNKYLVAFHLKSARCLRHWKLSILVLSLMVGPSEPYFCSLSVSFCLFPLFTHCPPLRFLVPLVPVCLMVSLSAAISTVFTSLSLLPLSLRNTSYSVRVPLPQEFRWCMLCNSQSLIHAPWLLLILTL